jgi:hypothetical protein
MKKDDSFWEWAPLVSFGVFQFGSPLSNYKRLRLIYLEEESTIFDEKENEELNHFAYTLSGYENNLRIYTDTQRKLTSVLSKRFIFKGHHLIGLKVEQICDILGKKYDSHDDIGIEGENWFSYTFDDLGLFLWEEDGIITSITSSLAYED